MTDEAPKRKHIATIRGQMTNGLPLVHRIEASSWDEAETLATEYVDGIATMLVGESAHVEVVKAPRFEVVGNERASKMLTLIADRMGELLAEDRTTQDTIDEGIRANLDEAVELTEAVANDLIAHLHEQGRL